MADTCKPARGGSGKRSASSAEFVEAVSQPCVEHQADAARGGAHLGQHSSTAESISERLRPAGTDESATATLSRRPSPPRAAETASNQMVGELCGMKPTLVGHEVVAPCDLEPSGLGGGVGACGRGRARNDHYGTHGQGVEKVIDGRWCIEPCHGGQAARSATWRITSRVNLVWFEATGSARSVTLPGAGQSRSAIAGAPGRIPAAEASRWVQRTRMRARLYSSRASLNLKLALGRVGVVGEDVEIRRYPSITGKTQKRRACSRCDNGAVTRRGTRSSYTATRVGVVVRHRPLELSELCHCRVEVGITGAGRRWVRSPLTASPAVRHARAP